MLLRCAQEIITNAVRHAAARNLWIRCRREGAELVMDARDDGRGAAELIGGNGLRGMRERLRQYGGQLQLDAARGRASAWPCACRRPATIRCCPAR